MAKANDLPTVLVVDDDLIHLEIVALLLQGHAHVEMAETGAEALKQAARLCSAAAPPLVILMDVRMPGLSGASLAAALLDTCPGGRLMGMSASEPAAEVRRLCHTFLPKPLTEAALVGALRSWPSLEREASATPAATLQAPQHIRGEVLAKLASMLPPEALQGLFEVYVRDAEQRIAVLHECEERWDAECAAQAAHALKGSSGMLGFEYMASLAATLETHCMAGETGTLSSEIRGLEEEFACLRGLLARQTETAMPRMDHS